MKKQGMSLIDGSYRSGKTTIAIGMIHAYLGKSAQVKALREKQKGAKVVKTYSIKELLENESSDDEGYTPATTKTS